MGGLLLLLLSSGLLAGSIAYAKSQATFPPGYNSVFSYNTITCRNSDPRQMKFLAWKPPNEQEQQQPEFGADKSINSGADKSIDGGGHGRGHYNCSCSSQPDCCDERTFCTKVVIQRVDFTPTTRMKPDPRTGNYSVYIVLNGTWDFDDFEGQGSGGLVVVSDQWSSDECVRFGGWHIFSFAFSSFYIRSFEVQLDRPYKYIRACFQNELPRNVTATWSVDAELSVFWRS